MCHQCVRLVPPIGAFERETSPFCPHSNTFALLRCRTKRHSNSLALIAWCMPSNNLDCLRSNTNSYLQLPWGHLISLFFSSCGSLRRVVFSLVWWDLLWKINVKPNSFVFQILYFEKYVSTMTNNLGQWSNVKNKLNKLMKRDHTIIFKPLDLHFVFKLIFSYQLKKILMVSLRMFGVRNRSIWVGWRVKILLFCKKMWREEVVVWVKKNLSIQIQ